jgi:hypothetical protein
VTQYDDELCTRNMTREFHAAQDVVIDEVSGDSSAKDISDPLVEDQLGRDPGVDAAEYDRKGPLATGGFIDLRKQVSIGFRVGPKPRISFLEEC